MNSITNFLPPNVVALFKRLGIYLLFMQITRILFFVFNKSIFQTYNFLDIIGGIWFDIVTFCLIGLPYIFFQSIPFKFRATPYYQKFLNVLYYVLLLFSLAFNLVDVEFYKHSLKRSTVDLFSIVSTGNDFQQQLSSFITDFWYHYIFFIIFVFILVKVHKKSFHYPIFTNYKKEIIAFVLVIGLSIIGGRGGLGLRPISPLNASDFTNADKAALVLNTPFTIVKSFGKQFLEIPNYFNEEQLLALENPIKKSTPQHLFTEQKNVVILLLESFGAEFVGAAGAENSFTPFLDSIAAKSLNFNYGISNGKRSIEAIPAIYLSLPSWMEEAYITSPYADNKVTSLADILQKNNYETAFFHGATNGSMRFDSFTKQVGVNHYFGRKEYNNDKHFDGTWGILDEYFLPWSVQKMSNFKQPFFSTIFTLSSHHPYYIPENRKGKLKKGAHPLCETIHYTDESLRIFFEEAQKQSWYENTIFVFMADHTPAAVDAKYASSKEVFHIPILIFDPTAKLEPQSTDVYFQQIDLYPTLLDLLNIETDYYAFGNSYFSNKNEAMSQSGGTYYYFFDNYQLLFRDEKSWQLINVKSKTPELLDSTQFYPEKVQDSENSVKAKLQTYNRDLVENRTFVGKSD